MVICGLVGINLKDTKFFTLVSLRELHSQVTGRFTLQGLRSATSTYGELNEKRDCDESQSLFSPLSRPLLRAVNKTGVYSASTSFILNLTLP